MFGTRYLSTKANSSIWSESRLERSKALAEESRLALERATKTLQYDAETLRNLEQLGLAEAAFNSTSRNFKGQIRQAHKAIKANQIEGSGGHIAALAQRFKYAALEGG